ncbi:hypothetical protein RIF29_19198 [Crotalaria pallida]|uniref:Uncharacterized protein n=1 Tax=Crotalaria pallida TaxID=3830 RepID=A0AAN9F3G4_CROPI
MSMKLNSKHSYKLSVKRATRRVRKQQPQHQQQQQQQRRIRTICKARTSFKPIKSKLSQKLQALRNLISPHNEDIVKPDQLFQETADYIVLLRTRVVILQKLIEFYGSDNPENENAMLL